MLTLALMVLAGHSQPARADDPSTPPTVQPPATAGTSALQGAAGPDGQPATAGAPTSQQACNGAACTGWKVTIINQTQYQLVARAPTFFDNVVNMSQLIQPGGQGSVEGKESTLGGPANMNFTYDAKINNMGGYSPVLVRVRAQWEQGIYIPNVDCSSPGGCTFLNPRGASPIQLEIR